MTTIEVDVDALLNDLAYFTSRRDICRFEPLREINEDENKMIFEG